MTRLLADETPGTHATVQVLGLTFNYQTLISTIIAVTLTIVFGLLVASRVRTGTAPGKVQMIFELFLNYVRRMVGDTVSDQAGFVIPIAATIGFYILVANWLDFFPLQKPIEPATSDLNQTLAMALVVILVVQWYSVHVQGWRGYLRRFTKPLEASWWIRGPFIILNVVEELVKPVTLSLRLFGNIFAGVVMIYLLGQLFAAGSAFISKTLFGGFAVALMLVWKFFDVFFVGTIQAFIFMLLSIIYFGHAREGLEEEGHHAAQPAPATT
jgi:F-type H+-transporting ATPase subunit a